MKIKILITISLCLLIFTLLSLNLPNLKANRFNGTIYNYEFRLKQSDYTMQFIDYNQTENNIASSIYYAYHNILNDSNYSKSINISYTDTTGYVYSFNQIILKKQNDYLWLYLFESTNENYWTFAEFEINGGNFQDIYVDNDINRIFDITNQSIILDPVLNYLFQFNHHIIGGWYSFTSINELNISNVSGSYELRFNLKGNSQYVYETTQYASSYFTSITFQKNGYNWGFDFGRGYTYTEELPVNSNYFKNLYLENQYIDAILWNYLDDNGTWDYIPLAKEVNSFYDVLDAYVNIPIRITRSMLNWSAMGINMLIALGSVLVIIISIKVIRMVV